MSILNSTLIFLYPRYLFFCISAAVKLQKTAHLFFPRKNVPPSHDMLSYHLIFASFLLYYTVALKHHSNDIKTRKCSYAFCLTCQFSCIRQNYRIFAGFTEMLSEYIVFWISRTRACSGYADGRVRGRLSLSYLQKSPSKQCLPMIP